MEKVVNVHMVNDRELDDMERSIYAAAYVAKLLCPHEGPPMQPMGRVVNGERRPLSVAMACAAWAVATFRADQAAR